MTTANKKFSAEDLQKIDNADDLKISPFRADGITYGTPTWIWAVVVEGELYVRAYNGIHSSWYQSAVKQKAGRIHAAGMVKEVVFEIANGAVNDKIDEAYRAKYTKSPYLPPMLSPGAIAATIKIIPQTV